ncbi:intein domain protein [Phage NCTB]|nr:intein domain protein [Phage NCTB]
MLKQVITCVNSKRNARDLHFGDVVSCVRIPNMPGSRYGNDYAVMDWATENRDSIFLCESFVSRRTDSYREGYFKINTMHFVTGYPLFVCRNSIWQWVMPKSVRIGDLLMNDKLETVEVVSHEYITERAQSSDLKVCMFDSFFMNGILVHNKVD